MPFRDSQSRHHNVSDGYYGGPDRRSESGSPATVTPVRLTRKFAEAIDGVNLSGHGVGDRLPLPARDARLLVAEGWAEPERTRSSDLIRASASEEFQEKTRLR